MRESIFRFKKFSIINKDSAMKVGTDGVLIGAWADVGEPGLKILDIGMGTGLISLMVAQRNDSALITGVEIDSIAAQEARLNISNSQWSDRIKVENIDFLQYNSDTFFDRIVSNPPFFTTGILAPAEERAVARHAQNFTIENILRKCLSLLSDNGKISFIYPASDIELVKNAILTSNLHINRMCYVYPRADLPCKRIMWECSRIAYQNIIEEQLIIEESRHLYTGEYIALTRDFYLKM